MAISGHQKGPAAPCLTSGTQNAIAKTLHAKSGDSETIDAEKANIKDKSVARSIGMMKIHPHNALHTYPENAAGKMNAIESTLATAAEAITLADPMINGHQKVTAEPLNRNTMIQGATIPTQSKGHDETADPLHIGSQSTTRDITKRIIKGVETIAHTLNEGMIGDTTRKDHRQH